MPALKKTTLRVTLLHPVGSEFDVSGVMQALTYSTGECEAHVEMEDETVVLNEDDARTALNRHGLELEDSVGEDEDKGDAQKDRDGPHARNGEPGR